MRARQRDALVTAAKTVRGMLGGPERHLEIGRAHSLILELDLERRPLTIGQARRFASMVRASGLADRDPQLGRLIAAFDESKVKRDHGRFATKEGSGGDDEQQGLPGMEDSWLEPNMDGQLEKRTQLSMDFDGGTLDEGPMESTRSRPAGSAPEWDREASDAAARQASIANPASTLPPPSRSSPGSFRRKMQDPDFSAGYQAAELEGLGRDEALAFLSQTIGDPGAPKQYVEGVKQRVSDIFAGAGGDQGGRRLGPDGAMGLPGSKDRAAALESVPRPVQEHVRRQLGYLSEVKKALEEARGLDEQFGGGGTRYQGEVWDKNREKVEKAQAGLAKFRELAPTNGVDAEAVIGALGGEPSIKVADERSGGGSSGAKKLEQMDTEEIETLKLQTEQDLNSGIGNSHTALKDLEAYDAELARRTQARDDSDLRDAYTRGVFR